MFILENDPLEAGRVYKSTGALPKNILRSTVYRAWERSHLQGANPHALQAEKLSSLETERLVEQQSYLLNVVRPYFQILSQAAGKEPHAVMLGDRQAILLGLTGDEQTINSPSFPAAGSLLSESVAGANGIGTPLAEEDYVEIIASEHFIEGFHPFTCQGIPLRNEKQEIVGVLSISSQRQDAGQRLKEILLCASRAVEAEFLIANLKKDIHHVLTSNPEEYQPLEELRQDIIQAHHAARLKLEVSSRMVAVNRLDYAKQLLQQAEKSIRIFQRHAAIWRNLASSDVGSVEIISLTETIQDVVELLSTEASIRRIEVVTNWQEPITVITEPASLSRHLLRYFLQAFDMAGKGGTLEVAAKRVANSEFVLVSFLPIATLNTYPLQPTPLIYSLPIKN
ncbi:sigma-54-dependent Fis family transcriptional regulator [Nostoc parmelioides]|uniref:Sigma-54-dependent Fis family transcriptional regulator n=1 Tax=Nostoc parmelioides FACHB-3921 TaxID=2692909 RepID=A0ABR8BS25_9NOSO|nr:sigma-54-dependent Fis family transcriptional regulator [Nostoc parmelioides]MBD2255713.1 sigma-54-dependent Fis family transcriptional regulator [Nostoc parmelioides FACHB-3921]